jgi:hypothetical protein
MHRRKAPATSGALFGSWCAHHHIIGMADFPGWRTALIFALMAPLLLRKPAEPKAGGAH